MIDIKISIPGHANNLTFKNFYSKNQNHKFNYHINNEISKADFWLVLEDLKYESETCEVPKNNIFHLNNETSHRVNHYFENHIVKFLNQFSKAFGPFATRHKNHVSVPSFAQWMIHSNHGDEIFEDSNFDFDYFSKLNNLEKSIDLSVICSNKSHTENHSLRLEFVKILKDYFGEKLHWYGNGINTIEKKSDIIFKSKYHIALENCSRHNTVTKKLYDSFLGLSFPIYYGATNVNELFEKDSLITIDINDVSNSIRTIETVLKSNLYEKNFNHILKSKDRVLREFNIYYRLNKLIEENISANTSAPEEVTLYSSNYYWEKTASNKKKIKRVLKRKMRL